MSESTVPVTELASQYIAQVTGDLERNMKEQERIGTEIAALQEQLAVLQHDHTVLANMHQALGVEAAAPAVTDTTPDSAVVPSPRQKTSAESAPSKSARTRKSSASAGRTSPRKQVAKKKPAAKAASPAQSAQPTLVELVRRHLSEQSEPRSAAEVTTALDQAHPERSIKTTVVRTTLEGLVAKNHAQRTKQGTSVFYTASEAAEKSPAAEAEKPSESVAG
ncbi:MULTISPECIES: BlaI/MecI/CopY family transcriptional regulator [Streptomyces]|uniref:BlaI/MecI/CopY family transcriptional regulator n=1 Tax=Streptomyces herbicida TaxID=3065675 RepID=UPI002930EEFA|nr:BlaI/MecI/CopY family transcriptional regulator [Streptomyces sp. NEAU-HV9]